MMVQATADALEARLPGDAQEQRSEQAQNQTSYSIKLSRDKTTHLPSSPLPSRGRVVDSGQVSAVNDKTLAQRPPFLRKGKQLVTPSTLDSVRQLQGP